MANAARLLLLAAAVSAAHPPKHETAWDRLRSELEGWAFTDSFSVAVGNASGNVFTYERGNVTMDTRVETASTSKWPVAMMFAGLVDDGTIESLDAKASDVVPWWTKDASDNRSAVTLRHLLSFTSGFGTGKPGSEGGGNKTCMDDPTPPRATTYEACARELYETYAFKGTPGREYAYDSIHLQLAGAVATHASGLSIREIVRKYLVEPYGMKATTCGRGLVPQMATCLTTTGRDYERFLRAQLAKDVLAAEIVDASERDYTPFLTDYYTLYGNYGFGHFLECFDSVEGFTEDCKAAMIHSDPGAFGFYPLVDRRLGYYMEIVAFEASKRDYPRSGIPEYLRLLVKPLADAAIAGEGGYDFAHHGPAQKGLTLADVNYVADCYLHPEHCA